MPTRIYLPDDVGNRSRDGIDITWTPSANRLDIGGWYDSFVGIETTSLTLAEFFNRLNITDKDIIKATKQRKKT